MKRKPWTAAEIALLRERYPHEPTVAIAELLGRPVKHVYAQASNHRLAKTEEYLASPAACRLRRGDNVGAAYRFPKGHVPANKGLHRPGWAPGRMRETQFKKGGFPVNRDPDFYVIGALRVNHDGYIDMRISFAPGARGWRALHRILWEDTHGPVPATHALVFKDGDRLNVELDNLELVTRADLCRRNSIHNLPPELADVMRLRGAVIRQINKRLQRHAA